MEGKRWPYWSRVMVIDEWPSHSWMALGGAELNEERYASVSQVVGRNTGEIGAFSGGCEVAVAEVALATRAIGVVGPDPGVTGSITAQVAKVIGEGAG